MQKIKLGLLAFVLLMVTSVANVSAITTTASIQDLPEYINTNNFKLSCSALGGSTAQFAVMKEGGSYVNFGSEIDLTTSVCQVQVTSSEVNDQTKYYFKVTVNGSVSDETSTFYDTSGPSPVSGYYKEKIGEGSYKLHWKNPGDSDFSKVVIYRGETSDFSADSSHEIARVSGGSNSDMTYDENQPDPNKTYYYLIRALDRANNSSSLVGDGGTTTSTSSTPTQGSVLGTNTAGKIQTPTQGSVLGSEATPTGSPLPTTEAQVNEANDETGIVKFINEGGLINWIKNNKTTSLVIALGIGLISFYLYKLRGKK